MVVDHISVYGKAKMMGAKKLRKGKEKSGLL
jgi:hypothetical protein